MKNLSLFVFLLSCLSIHAQTLESVPNQLTGQFVACPDNKVEMPFTVTNTLAEDVTAFWYVNRIDVPSQWQLQICDANLCYGWGREDCPEDRENLFAPNQSINIFSIKVGIDVNGYAQDGIGTFEFVMINTLDSTDVLLTLPFEVTGTACMSSTDETEVEDQDALFPNPTNGVLNVREANGLSQINFFDLKGQLVKSEDKISSSIDVSELLPGIYLVRSIDALGNQTNIQKIIKI